MVDINKDGIKQLESIRVKKKKSTLFWSFQYLKALASFLTFFSSRTHLFGSLTEKKHLSSHYVPGIKLNVKDMDQGFLFKKLKL